MSTTLRDVRAAFANVKRVAESIGVEHADRWVLQEGSATYGYAWRICERDPQTGGHRAGESLGMTRAEAERSLRGIAHGLIIGAEVTRERVSAR